MERFSSIASLSDFIHSRKSQGNSVVFVPTMGALHEGHRVCVDLARDLGSLLVVSIFVNPTQFGPGEDLDKYPRDHGADMALCEKWGADVVFLPAVEEVYPAGEDMRVEAGAIAEPLCGRTRAGHFSGVATVVARLFRIVEPDMAVFGQKDAQQALVIREMVRRLSLPVELRLAPIARESDGLALSSRNRYLTTEERAQAAGLFRSLSFGKTLVERGERDPTAATRQVTDRLASLGIDDVEYVDLLAAGDLTPLREVSGRVILAAAVRIGTTRLIDNIVLDVGSDGSVREAMLF